VYESPNSFGEGVEIASNWGLCRALGRGRRWSEQDNATDHDVTSVRDRFGVHFITGIHYDLVFFARLAIGSEDSNFMSSLLNGASLTRDGTLPVP
jgi:hypothetical protein